MLYMVTGGSGSGKSEYAENLAVKLFQENDGRQLYYIATMCSCDEDSRKRIMRHKKQRFGKGFTTIECDTNLERIQVYDGDVILLEDMSNLLANEMYAEYGRIKVRDDTALKQIEEIIVNPVLQLEKQAGKIIVVTNEVSSDGMEYDEETKCYVRLLGRINHKLADAADGVAEVVAGIPLWNKGKPSKEKM